MFKLNFVFIIVVMFTFIFLVPFILSLSFRLLTLLLWLSLDSVFFFLSSFHCDVTRRCLLSSVYLFGTVSFLFNVYNLKTNSCAAIIIVNILNHFARKQHLMKEKERIKRATSTHVCMHAHMS